MIWRITKYHIELLSLSGKTLHYGKYITFINLCSVRQMCMLCIVFQNICCSLIDQAGMLRPTAKGLQPQASGTSKYIKYSLAYDLAPQNTEQ